MASNLSCVAKFRWGLGGRVRAALSVILLFRIRDKSHLGDHLVLLVRRLAVDSCPFGKPCSRILGRDFAYFQLYDKRVERVAFFGVRSGRCRGSPSLWRFSALSGVGST